MNEQAEVYFKRYQEAEPEQKPVIAEEFQMFFNRLTEPEKASAEPFLKYIRQQISQQISTLDSLTAKAENVLQRRILHED